jgi:hypothetical protein
MNRHPCPHCKATALSTTPPSLLPRFAIWVHHRRGFKRGPICDVNSDRGCIRVLMERTKEAGSAGKLIGPSLVSLVRVFKGRGVG